MRAGIPLWKLECSDLRNLLEQNGYRLTDPRHLLDMVPFILREERTSTRSEIKGKYLSVVFDGTSRLGEVLAVVVRFISNWNIEQLLVRLEFLQKSLNGEELARQLLGTLSVTLGIESDKLIAVMHDRANVNRAAMRIVQVVYPTIIDIGCISHTIDIVGDKFQVPKLHLFFTLWISLFSHSPKLKHFGRKEQAELCHLTVTRVGGAVGKYNVRFYNNLGTSSLSCSSTKTLVLQLAPRSWLYFITLRNF